MSDSSGSGGGGLGPSAGLPIPHNFGEISVTSPPNTLAETSGTAAPSELWGAKFVTVDEFDIGHLLSDAQLDSVSSCGNDSSFNWFAVFIGAAAGFTQNVFSAAGAVYHGNVPTGMDFTLGIISVAFYAAAIAKFTEYRRNKSKHGDLLKAIKSRKKVQIR